MRDFKQAPRREAGETPPSAPRGTEEAESLVQRAGRLLRREALPAREDGADGLPPAGGADAARRSPVQPYRIPPEYTKRRRRRGRLLLLLALALLLAAALLLGRGWIKV